MKKLSIVFLMFLGVVVGSAIPFSSVHASTYCWVSTESDPMSSSGRSTDSGALRAKITSVYNSGSSANCNPPSTSPSDKDYFGQVILFATSSTGWANDIQTVTLGSSSQKDKTITFSNTSSDKTLVIGNWSSESVNDSSSEKIYDSSYKSLYTTNYGTVTIDARTNFSSGKIPFICGSSSQQNVYFRNVIIETNGVSADDFFSDTNTQTKCLKNGGAVTIDDGTGTSTSSTTDADGDGYTTDAGDCNDNDSTIYPGATEVCADGIDNDCDGTKDNNIATYYYDGDGDGYYATDAATLQACTPPATGAEGYTTVDYSNDCDDANASVNPAATEICGNEVDENCDLDVRSTCETCTNSTDDNGDSLVDCEDPDCAADASCNGTVETDCTNVDASGVAVDDDADGSANCADSDCATDAACAITATVEICDNLIDDNGDGAIDCDDATCANDAACSTASIDEDGDGQSTADGDCNDANAAVYSGAAEVCGTCTDNTDVSTCTADGVDNNCDGSVDEGCAGSPFIDDDKDGYCEDATSCSDNSQPGDCDDTNSAINPGVGEVCSDLVDNNCDGSVDETTSCDENIAPPSSSSCGCDLTAHKPQMASLLMMILLALIPYMAGYALRSKSI